MGEDARFDRLRRAWGTVVAWNVSADPLCPCKGLVAPNLADWLRFEQEALRDPPDARALDEQAASLREAIAYINQYSRPGPVGDLTREFMAYKVDAKQSAREAAENDACEAGDPRCMPLAKSDQDVNWTFGLKAVRDAGIAAGPSQQTESDLRRELPALRGMLDRLDPRMGAGEAPEAGGGIPGILASLPSLLGDTARGAGQAAGTAAGQAAGQAAAEAAKTAAPAVAAAIGESLKGQLPALANAAGQAAAPVVAPIATSAGQTAGAAAGKAAADSFADAGAWPMPLKVGIGILGFGAVGGALWALFNARGGKRK